MNRLPQHPACLPIEALLKECQVRRQRRSGPGGQHRNKVETAVIITHVPTGVKGEASERRSQWQNQQVAVSRLRVNLAVGIRTEPVEPCEVWRKRRSGNRIEINVKHDEFPSLLAHALNVLAAHEMNHQQAAAQLGISGSQLVGLLKKEPAALERLNQHRRQRGAAPLQ